jgi:hypothetical protein
LIQATSSFVQFLQSLPHQKKQIVVIVIYKIYVSNI